MLGRALHAHFIAFWSWSQVSKSKAVGARASVSASTDGATEQQAPRLCACRLLLRQGSSLRRSRNLIARRRPCPSIAKPSSPTSSRPLCRLPDDVHTAKSVGWAFAGIALRIRRTMYHSRHPELDAMHAKCVSPSRTRFVVRATRQFAYGQRPPGA